MGVYARTNFEVTCDTHDTAKKVLKVLEERTKEGDANGNTFGRDLQIEDNQVFGEEDSPRVQNLEYRTQEMWEAIKDIKGVQELNAPFLLEGDGMYFSNEDNE